MGRVFKPIVYKALPNGAEVFSRKGERFARWTDKRGRGRTRTAPVRVPERGEHAGQLRIVVESARYVAVYRDADGVHTVPTGCRDETAARGVLRELERRAELVKGNLLSASEARAVEHHAAPIAEHVEAFATYLQGATSSKAYRATALGRLRRLIADCGFGTLADLDRTKLESWLARTPASMAPTTRSGYVNSLVGFVNWAVNAGRLTANPFTRMAGVNGKAGQKRPRRAMTAAELGRLIDAARRRPLAEYGRQPVGLPPRPGRRVSWTYELLTPDNLAECEARARERFKDRPDVLAEAEAAGRVRALAYKALALTGLRLGELRSITVGAVTLEGPEPYAVLKAADEKARRGAEVPLRADLAADLSLHLAKRLRVQQRAAVREGRPIPARLAADAPLIDLNLA